MSGQPEAITEGACTASTPADGIMVGCELDAHGPEVRHRGTYVREFAGDGLEVEVTWETGGPAYGPLSVPPDEYAAIRGVAEAMGHLPPGGSVAAPEPPAAESPAPAPPGAPTAIVDAAGGVTDETVTAALLADVEWARAGRELVWQTLSAERARNLIGAAVRVEQERAEADRARLAELENAITWHTLCTSCAGIADSAIAERERAERAETELEHAKSAAAGSHEGIRLWMLDCGSLVQKHREHAAEASARLGEQRERAEQAEARLANVRAYCEGWLESHPCCPEPAEDILSAAGTGEQEGDHG